MREKSIIITGASGFIGNELVKYFAAENYKVYAFARSYPYEMPDNVVYVKYFLSSSRIDENIFRNTDYIIHCAYAKYDSKHKDSDKINREGTQRLLNFARKYNLKKFVYFSSFSAMPDADSHYGRSKLEIESIFDINKDLILRPGLVIGNGGLYKSIRDIVSKSKFVPMLGGGRQPIQTLSIEDLFLIIKKGLENNISGIYAVAEPQSIPMKILYKAITAQTGKKKIFISVPYWCAELLIFITGFFHIKFSVSKENILGLKKSRSYDIRKMSEVFSITPADYEVTIEKIKKSQTPY